VDLDREACYRAIRTRDIRFDGRFYTGVRTTGVYCRPICPSRMPRFEHCVFFPSAAAAHQAGYRPCLRCRPELAPGLAGWRGTAATVSRALTAILDGGLDIGGVEGLAARIGVTGRHLRRLFDRHLGAPPIAVVQAYRILFAKKLIAETAMSMADVAFAAGFGSVRRFNDVMRRTYARSPLELRRSARRGNRARASGITLKLPFTPPYHWPAMVTFLAQRAIPGVESVESGCYRRTITLDDARGIVEVRPVEGEHYLLAAITISNLAALAGIVARLRQLFDLDADIRAIESHLARDPRLASCVKTHPGARVPGAWDDFELATRAILGQQISVAHATQLAGRLAAAYGEPIASERDLEPAPGLRLLFPRPEALAGAGLTGLGLPRSRATALSSLAAAMVNDPHLLRSFDHLDVAVEKLSRLPGIGGWTAQYIAMRALHEPDAFPATDLGLLRAMATRDGRPTPARLMRTAEAWRPWRAYAAVHLWLEHARSTPAGLPPAEPRRLIVLKGARRAGADRPGRRMHNARVS
jgi:AraC family transcriptional regulator, regulatory protein of adaptative response / DNA-3-methyladenine glycosylase II